MAPRAQGALGRLIVGVRAGDENGHVFPHQSDDCTLQPSCYAVTYGNAAFAQGLTLNTDRLDNDKPILVLGIETTCDETAAAVVERRRDGTGRILSNIVRSQIAEHAPFG